MIEVEINSIRVSLMNNQRIVVLKDINSERYLPIFIGQYEADAINFELQEATPPHPRPLTHDLLKNIIQEMGGLVRYIFVSDLRDDTFYARIIIEVDDKTLEIDSRPSDAIALALRAKAGIFVSEAVMERSSLEPEEDVELQDSDVDFSPSTALSGKGFDDDDADEPAEEDIDESKFSAFADFVNTLDLDELDDDDKQ